MNLLFFAGSLRQDSCNKKLAREAQRLAAAAGYSGEYIDIKDYPMPVYDGDIEATSGIPQGTIQLGRKIRSASALIISTPEYNGSIPGILKNAVDWLSREKDVSLANKHLLLLAASPGALGGIRVLWHARQPFEVLGMHVFPTMLGVANAYEAFDEQGHLKDQGTVLKLQKALEGFVKKLAP